MMDIDAYESIIKDIDLVIEPSGPQLLFGPDEARFIRARAREELVSGIVWEDWMHYGGQSKNPPKPEPITIAEFKRRKCHELINGEQYEPGPQFARHITTRINTVAEGYFYTGESEFAEWVLDRAESLYGIETWMAPPHGEGGGPDSHADHVMGNIAANLACACDLLGDAWSGEHRDQLAEALRNKAIRQFIYSTNKRKAWWAYEDWKTNWKIMCCGEMGFATLAFADLIPESREALWYATRGVLETLDAVPEEGDWEEGVTYWFVTLFMGLRFAIALRRMTNGEIDLLQHPSLSRTGDFAHMLTTPGGRLYDFNDNISRMVPSAADALLVIARETGRHDWLQTARTFGSSSPLWLMFDDLALESPPTEGTTALFPWTGVASARSGWTADDSFIGMKSTKAQVSHCHMDHNSFVFEARGVPLIVEEGTWPYAARLGFHEMEDRRWDFDGLSTVGHSTLMVDGQGQSCDESLSGKITEVEAGDGWHRITGDAGPVYPGLLKTFVRTLLLVGRDTLIVHDRVVCEGERRVEFLLHYGGEVRSEGCSSVIENQGVSLVVTPFLPDRSSGWRVSDVTRTSEYEDHANLAQVSPSIRYRSFTPFRPAESFEFLFGMQIGGSTAGDDWEFVESDGGWSLRAVHAATVVGCASGEEPRVTAS